MEKRKDIDMLRFYGGDIHQKNKEGEYVITNNLVNPKNKEDVLWGDRDAYRTLNALLFDGIENEKERIYKEKRKLNPVFIELIENTLEIYRGIFAVMCRKKGNQLSVSKVKRVDRKASLMAYLKGAIGLNADLSKRETFDLILKTAGDRKIDVVIAGPPCQGFSLTGPRNFDDPRNKLYLAVIEMVKQYNPKGFIIENVPGMANMYKGQVKDEVLKRFRKMGYNIDCRILKACDYGVPQMRKRLVFMGVRKDIGNPHFPDPTFGPETKKPYRTCRDAISDLPTRTNNLGKNEDEYVKPAETEYQVLMRDGCSILYNHIATNHKQFVKDTIALVPEGGNYKDLPEGVGNSRNFHMAWTRLDGNAPARTVDTGHRNLFHYELNRVPTVRESARIQSFPDNFVFKGSRTKQERQVGNAVPPLLGQALAEELLKIIERSKTNA